MCGRVWKAVSSTWIANFQSEQVQCLLGLAWTRAATTVVVPDPFEGCPQRMNSLTHKALAKYGG